MTDEYDPNQMSGSHDILDYQALTTAALEQLDGSDHQQSSRPRDDDAGSDSELSEIDDQLFEGFNEGAVGETVVPVGEEALSKLSKHRLERDPEEEAAYQQKREEARRRKAQQLKRRKDTPPRDEQNSQQVERQSKQRRPAGEGSSGANRTKSKLNLEGLTEDELKLYLFNKKVDEAISSGKKRRKAKDSIALDAFNDGKIADLRERMMRAAEEDYNEVLAGRPALHKLQMLDEVRNVMNKPNLIASCMDNNLLSAVKRWLEPLNKHSLPAHTIQKELFTWLATIKPSTDILRESGIGRIVSFYTKDIRPAAEIKRQAEVLVREWSRPILGKSDDYRTKAYERRRFDPTMVPKAVIANSGKKTSAPESNDQSGVKRRRIIPQATTSVYNVAPVPLERHSAMSSKSEKQSGGGQRKARPLD